MASSVVVRKCMIWGKIMLLCMCATVHSHILVYRRITNQIIEEYNDLPASFGPGLPPNGLKVYAIPLEKLLPDDYGCEELPRPNREDYPSNARFVAIIQRGGENCTFEKKIRHAQAASYNAAIIYNNEGDDLEQMSAKNSSGIYIPSVFVGHTAGLGLREFYTNEVVLVVNDELPFNINTQLILPFSILIGLCFLIMIFYMIYKCIREERRLRRHRLPKRLLKKLPIIKYSKNSDLSYDTCVICLDEFVEDDKLRVLPCRHPYHSHCIDPWLTENRRFCPICKRKVFTKGEARSNRNRQSSLETDTDDDTTPLLQQSSNSGGDAAVAVNSTNNSSTRHGTFRRTGGNNTEVVTSDDESVLQSPRRRLNPFDRVPEVSESNSNNGRSWWQFGIFRRFGGDSNNLSVAAPPLEEVLSDIAASASNSAMLISQQHSSNNILNPHLSGSFKENEHTQRNSSDDDSHEADASIYEPAEPIISDADSVFIQTPSQGGIGVVALPNPNTSNHQVQNEERRPFYR